MRLINPLVSNKPIKCFVFLRTIKGDIYFTRTNDLQKTHVKVALHFIQFNTVAQFKIFIFTLQIVFQKSLLHPCLITMFCCYLIKSPLSNKIFSFLGSSVSVSNGKSSCYSVSFLLGSSVSDENFQSLFSPKLFI